MKLRTDFVTNSSSSSFILGFKKENDVKTDVVNSFPEEYIKSLGIVLSDISKAKRMNKDEVIERIRDDLKWSAEWHVEDQYRYENYCTYSEASKYIKSEEGKKRIEKYLDEIIEDAKKKMDKKSVFVEISYSDNDGEEFSNLEHEIMPYLDFTIISLNHH